MTLSASIHGPEAPNIGITPTGVSYVLYSSSAKCILDSADLLSRRHLFCETSTDARQTSAF